MLSRLESGGKIIIIMTRWNSNVLAGKALNELPQLGYRFKHISIKPLQDNGEMLFEDILSKQEYSRKTKAMEFEIAEANYNQNPIDFKGRLYSSFKTYSKRVEYKRIINYTDTADTGSDFLCSITAGETFDGELQVLDVLYTKEGMEETEPKTAKMLVTSNAVITYIELNNGGRGFARNVERILWEKHQTKKPSVKWFHQNKNKQARIFSNSTYVMDHIYFPENWKDKWPEYYKAMTSYQKEGKNAHDDAPDATTGLAEIMANKIGKTDKKQKY